MGYILPIPHYQYNDYQNRVIRDKQDPYYIEGPFKVMLGYGDWEKEWGTDEVEKYRRSGDTVPGDKLHVDGRVPVGEKILADLTGKGRNYNFTV